MSSAKWRTFCLDPNMLILELFNGPDLLWFQDIYLSCIVLVIFEDVFYMMASCFPLYCPFAWWIHRLPVITWHKWPVSHSFGRFYIVNLDEILNKQWRGGCNWPPQCSCDVTLMTPQSSTSILSPCSHGGNWRRIRCHAFKAPQLPWWTAPATLQPQVKGYSHYLYHGKLYHTGLILGLRPANERRRYFVTTSLIGWAQATLQP